MDVVVKGRHCEVTDRFRSHVTDKLARVARLESRAIRVDVEVSREHNPRQAGSAERVERTLHSRGPVVRAEAAAEDRYAALDLALDRLEGRLRRAADRRRVHHGSRRPLSVAEATAVPAPAPAGSSAGVATLDGSPAEAEPALLVREKTHRATPMTLEQALYEMELVGHDFYLFVDAQTAAPSVVYRRRGYDYGVIRLTD